MVLKKIFSIDFMSKVYDWFEERLEIQSIADDITSKYVPPHVNIFYCLGGITFTCFLVQVATGFAMTFYYATICVCYSPRITINERNSIQYNTCTTRWMDLVRWFVPTTSAIPSYSHQFC